MSRVFIAVLFLLSPTLSIGQNIVAIDCVRSWVGGTYSSCVGTQTGQSGFLRCECNATCGSTCAEIGAAFRVHWALTLPTYVGQGTISGGALASAVEVRGSLLIACGGVTDGGRGYNNEDCDGNRTGANFDVEC